MRTIVLMTALLTVAGCKRTPGYCASRNDCAGGMDCILPQHECQLAPPGSDLAMESTDMATGCVQPCGGTAPICDGATCEPCTMQPDGDAACAALGGGTPHCDPSGACVGCIDNTQCPDPQASVCDGTSKSCRRCRDTDCSSLICELTPGSPTYGQCVPETSIVYVDANGPNGDGKTPATAKAKVQDGINTAVGLNPARPYVHIAAGTYAENVGVNNNSISLVGADGVIIKPANGDALGVQGSNSTMTVRNVIASAPKGNAGNCTGATNALVAYQSQLTGSMQNGIISQMGCPITLDGDFVNGNMGGGVQPSGNFTVMNSIITNNTGYGGVNQAATGTTMYFFNDTVADNTASLATGGVTCQAVGGFTVANTILYNNKGGGGTPAELSTGCTASSVASDDPVGGATAAVDLRSQLPGFRLMPVPPSTPGYYHLAAGSPCIGKATAAGPPDHDFDLQPRPMTNGDIGADEYAP